MNITREERGDEVLREGNYSGRVKEMGVWKCTLKAGLVRGK